MKTLVTAFLASAILLVPFQRSRSDESTDTGPQPQMVGIVCGLFVLVAGVVVVIQLKKLCNKIPTYNGNEDPPVTNPPPHHLNSQVAPQAINPTGLTLTDDPIRYLDISALGMLDGDAPIFARMDYRIQTSDNAREWKTAYRVSGWVSPMGTTLLFCNADGAPVLTNYCAANNGKFPLDLGTGREPSRFFRICSP